MSKLLKKSFLIILAVAIIFIAWRSFANSPKAIIKKLAQNKTLEDAHSGLTFSLSFLGIFPVGQADINNKGIESYGRKSAYHLMARARPNKLFNLFYKVDAGAESFVDTNRLHTLKFMHRFSVYDELKEDKVILYDQLRHVMEYEDEERVILPDTHDPLSLIFFLMKQKFKKGDIFDLNVNTNQKNYKLTANVTERKTIVIKNKEFNLWKLEGGARRRSDSIRYSSDFAVWFLESSENLPILIKVFTNVGPIVIKIIDID